MQRNLECTIDLINSEITELNSSKNMSTPFIHTEIKRRIGPKDRPETRYYYNHLHDGVHPDSKTRDNWANTLLTVIKMNRTREELLEAEEISSPKRSWKNERKSFLSA